MNVNAISGYNGVTSTNKTNQKMQNTFQEVLTSAQSRKDSFTSSLSATEQDWFNDIRSRFTVSGMNWKKGQSLVSELVSKGVLRNDLNDLGNAIVIMFPPDCTDENGNLTRVVLGSECAELSLDAGYEDTTDYMGTLKSSLEHQWEAYNGMVEKYGDVFPANKAYLQEQEKLLGILQGLATA